MKGAAWSPRPGMGTLPLPGRGRDACNQADLLTITDKRFLIVSQDGRRSCLDVEWCNTAARNGHVGNEKPDEACPGQAHGTVCVAAV